MTVDNFYRRLPGPIQNFALTIYGLQQHRLRYETKISGMYRDYFAPCPQTAAETLSAMQTERLHALLLHAATYVPFYQRLFASIGVSPLEMTPESMRRHMPIVSRNDILRNVTDFYSVADNQRSVELKTSGSTGTPLVVRCAAEARALNYGFHRKLLRANGADVRDKKVTFAGRILFSAKEKKNFWRKDYYNQTLYCSSYHLSDESIPRYLQAIESWKPVFIDSYPSAIFQLALYIKQRSVSLACTPRFILTSSETLLEHQRRAIEEAFRAPVIDQYGCTEMATMAYSDGGSYVFDPLYSLVELVPTATPDTYDLICTGLLNFAMPLIRYRIGDVVLGSVELTRAFPPRITAVIGRQDDYICTPSGIKVGRMDPALKGVDGVQLSQLIQTELDRVELLVVLAPEADFHQVSQVLQRNIADRLGSEMEIRITKVDKIPLDKNGKFRSVVSRLNH